MNLHAEAINNLQSTSSHPSSSSSPHTTITTSLIDHQGYDESSDISTIDDDPLVNMLDKYSSDIFEDTSDEEEDDREDSEEEEDYDSDEDGEEPFPSSSAIATPHTITTITVKVPNIKRKRIRVRKYYPSKKKLLLAPRVLRSDIRRQYCVMMINAINSGDLELYRNFFKIYGMARVGLNALFPPPPTLNASSAGKECAVKVNGIDQIVCCLAGIFVAMPDFSIRIDNMEMYTIGGSVECKLECDITMIGTLLTPIWFGTIADEVLEVFDNLDIADTDSSGNSKSNKNRCEKVVQTASDKMSPKSTAKLQQTKVNIRGRMKVFINKDKQIYCMEMLPIV